VAAPYFSRPIFFLGGPPHFIFPCSLSSLLLPASSAPPPLLAGAWQGGAAGCRAAGSALVGRDPMHRCAPITTRRSQSLRAYDEVKATPEPRLTKESSDWRRVWAKPSISGTWAQGRRRNRPPDWLASFAGLNSKGTLLPAPAQTAARQIFRSFGSPAGLRSGPFTDRHRDLRRATRQEHGPCPHQDRGGEGPKETVTLSEAPRGSNSHCDGPLFLELAGYLRAQVRGNGRWKQGLGK